ncbi:MAG TPA: ABC transporter substrate-binding protein [Clostridia bacterium]|nr:ABC transporter substrate-binding protein [Clostridia bacterium]
MKKIVSLLLVVLMLGSLVACAPQTSAPAAEQPAATEAAQEAAPAEEATPAEPQQGVTDTEVLIANSIAVSGAYAPVGVPFKYGMEAYFKMVNDNGGIAGRTIKYIHTDDEFSPEKGIAAFEKFFYDDKVFAIVGHFGTPVVAATLDEMKELGIPTVYYATGIGQLYQEKAEGTNRSSFPIQPIYTTEGQVMVAYAKGYFNAKTIGVVYTNDDAGKSLFEGISIAAEKYGVTLVSESIQAGATDASAQVAKVKDCDMVIAAMIQATFPVLIKEMEKQDIMKPVLTTYVNVSKTLTDANAEHVQKLMKTEGAGIYGLGWVDTTDLTTESFVNFYKYMPEVGATEADMNAFAMTGWIAGSVFCQGLERAGKDLTWASFMDAMESAPIANPFGGSVDFSGGQRKGTTEMNLSKMDDTAASGWTLIIPIKSIDDILAGVK